MASTISLPLFDRGLFGASLLETSWFMLPPVADSSSSSFLSRLQIFSLNALSFSVLKRLRKRTISDGSNGFSFVYSLKLRKYSQTISSSEANSWNVSTINRKSVCLACLFALLSDSQLR